MGQRITIFSDINCRGLKTDKFGNLYFSDESNSWIGKIKKNDLSERFSKPNSDAEALRSHVIMLYDGKQ